MDLRLQLVKDIAADKITETGHVIMRFPTAKKVWTVRGSHPGRGEIFRTCPDRPWVPTSLLYNGYRVFPGGKERPRRDADHSPPSSAVVIKAYSYTSTPPMGCMACTEPQCLYKGAIYLYFYHSKKIYASLTNQNILCGRKKKR